MGQVQLIFRVTKKRLVMGLRKGRATSDGGQGQLQEGSDVRTKVWVIKRSCL
jgi:hypothetical protein